MGHAKHSGCAAGPSQMERTRFTRRVRCARCGALQFKICAPATFPVTVTAVTCVTCGETAGYIDETKPPVFALDPRFEMPPRAPTISHGAKPAFGDDRQKENVIAGLRLGVEADQIAEDLDVTREYVHAVAVNEQLLREIAPRRSVRRWAAGNGGAKLRGQWASILQRRAERFGG